MSFTKQYKPFKTPVYCPITEETAFDYGEYLRTDHWQELREVTAFLSKYTCQKCGKKIKLSESNLHHLNYKNLGNECQDDVLFLCRECHKKIHGIGVEEKPKKKKKKKHRKPSKLTRLIHSLTPKQKQEAYKMLKERFG